jgi:purine-binding chemotaxis protein CheW
MSQQAEALLPVLIFNIGDGLYALSIDDIVEVAAMVEMASVPDAPPEILGVVNRHGAIVPMVDLRKVFKQQSAPVLPSTLFIVVENGAGRAGLVVDDVQQVEYVNEAHFEGVSIPGRYIRGMISYKSQLVQLISLSPLWESFLVNQVAEKQG